MSEGRAILPSVPHQNTHTMLIDHFFSDNHTDFRIFQECDLNGYTYWVESLSSSGFYNITDGFSSYDEALNFTKQK